MSSSVYPYEGILGAQSLADLSASVRKYVGEAGFSSFHYGAHAPLKANGEKARFLFDGTEQRSMHVLSDYPDSWFSRYQSENYIEVDPLVKHCSQSILPVVWHLQPRPTIPRVAKMFDEAQQHGLRTGATFSLLGKNHEFGIFSLTTDRTRASDKRNVLNRLGHGYMLLVHLHEAMRRLKFADKTETKRVRLTPRERECLLWANSGTPSWEIAQNLRISERTVIYHIQNAMVKLDTNTRRHAIAKAISLGLINP